MKLYKDNKGEVFGFEDDGSQDHLITEFMTKINKEQESDMRNKDIATAKEKAIEKVKLIYEKSISSIQNKYSQSEINTFTRKSLSAKDYITNQQNCSTDSKILIYTLAGVSLDKKELTEEEKKLTNSKAAKILEKEKQLDILLAKEERERNNHLGCIDIYEEDEYALYILKDDFKSLQDSIPISKKV